MPLLPVLGVAAIAALLWLSNSKSGHALASQLDKGIPGDVATAVATAVLVERRPENLQAFSQSLLPDYPKASGVLLARAQQLPKG